MICPNEVRCGDAVDAFDGLSVGSVAAVVMDPPYASGGFSETARRGSRGQGVRSERVGEVAYFDGDNMGTAGIVWLLRAIAFRAFPALADGASLLCFCDWRQVSSVGPAIESSGLRWSNMLVWDKGSASLGSGFRARHEVCLHFTRGSGRYYSASEGNVLLERRVPSGDREHFAQKPVGLLRRMIEVVAEPGGLVVDPFCGSGSTGVAAALAGRRFLGVERDPEYCRVATERIALACGGTPTERGGQPGLFGPGEPSTVDRADAPGSREEA